MIRTRTAVLLLSLLTLPACDETDAVAVRIRLRDDFTGTVRTSGLVLPSEEHAVERETQGVTWGNRIDIACSSGTFSSIEALRIADIEFSAGSANDLVGFARVVIPRGEGVRWAKTFVPLDATQRKEAAGALDPSGRSVEVGSTIKIEFELPSTVIANGLTGKTRGVKASAEGAIATLVVPLETIHHGTESIVWHLTWQR
jgi:hypothetical protein